MTHPSREKHRYIISSNPQADDSVFLRRALLSPRILMLAEIAQDYGIERLCQEWEEIKDAPEAQRVAARANEILARLQQPAAPWKAPGSSSEAPSEGLERDIEEA